MEQNRFPVWISLTQRIGNFISYFLKKTVKNPFFVPVEKRIICNKDKSLPHIINLHNTEKLR